MQIITKLSAENTLKNITESEIIADKFLVSSNGNIRYRDGNNVIKDLGLSTLDIAYKTAYCSLEGYSNKETCESNGGTWYYSENNSHDSISSTAENQLLTVSQSIGNVDAESKLTYDGSTLEIKYNSDYDDNWQTSAQTELLRLSNNDDYFQIGVAAEGATTISTVDADTAVGHLTLAPDGDLVLAPASKKTIINSFDRLYFDGGSDTYIHEVSDDKIQFIVGDDGDIMLQLEEKGDDGNEVSFGSSCVGFTQLEPTYDATTTVVDFRHSNKQFVTFDSGNITNVNLTFPLVSGNFVLLLKQDGTGSRTVTNWKVMEFDETAADGSAAVKWAGGSAPTLTTDANHVDILSFYWDADNEIAYGAATLDFQF